MTCTEGREPSGLAMESLSRVLGDVRRYRIEGRAIETVSTANPYHPSVAAPADSPTGTPSIHTWCGHTISVECCTAAITLWLETTFIVTIDGTHCHRQRAFRLGDTFHFTFRHGRQLMHGNIARDLGLFARGMKYELTVDGKSVAKSQTPIHNWYLGVLTVLLGVPAIYAIIVAVVWLAD